MKKKEKEERKKLKRKKEFMIQKIIQRKVIYNVNMMLSSIQEKNIFSTDHIFADIYEY